MPPSREELQDRFRATLLGAAAGEAVGLAHAAGEGDFDPAVVIAGRAARTGWGEGTRSRQAVAEAIVAAGGIDGAAIAARLARLHREGALADAGPALKGAAAKLCAGTPWMAAGAPIGKAGNGPAVRAPAIGLWAAFEPRKLPRDAHVLAVITHKDPRASAAAAAIAAAVAAGLGGAPLDADTIAVAASLAASLDPGAGAEVGKAADLLPFDEGTALLALARLGAGPASRGGGLSSYAGASVAFALHAAVRSGGDFSAGLAATLRAGGDVAGAGQLVGAVIGAHRGCAAIPVRLRRAVRDAERIVDVADRLLAALLGEERHQRWRTSSARAGEFV